MATGQRLYTSTLFILLICRGAVSLSVLERDTDNKGEPDYEPELFGRDTDNTGEPDYEPGLFGRDTDNTGEPDYEPELFKRDTDNTGEPDYEPELFERKSEYIPKFRELFRKSKLF